MVDELHELVRGAYNFADLSRVQLENVLDMLAGRYPPTSSPSCGPDRLGSHGRRHPRPGRRAAARGHERGHDSRPRPCTASISSTAAVGGRARRRDGLRSARGQTFMLGASTWRIEEITRDRVLVSPAPGARVRSRSGRARGREAVRARRGDREGVAGIGCAPEAKALARLTEDHSLDEQAAQNLLTFLTDQQVATGAVPSDRTIVVERFRDEIGDWRVCILTPFGARVHAPWSMAIGARLRDALGLEVQSLVGRRDRDPPARRRCDPADGGADHRSGRDRGARDGRARRQCAVRIALP